jgi:hypothetical protein
VIRLISKNFVPVGLDLYIIRAAKSPAGDFYRELVRQKPQYQGVYLASPDGKVLCDTTFGKESKWQTVYLEQVKQGKKRDQAAMDYLLEELKEGLNAFGPVKPRPVVTSPYYARRAVGFHKNGGIDLAVTSKGFSPPLPKDLLELQRGAIGQGVPDLIPLSAFQVRTLLPDRFSSGVEWTVPESTAREFYHLLDPGPKDLSKPDLVTSVRLVGKVRAIREGVAYLSYEGEIAGNFVVSSGKFRLNGDQKLVGGVAAYDVPASKLLSLTLVSKGTRWGSAPDQRPGTPPSDGHYHHHASVVEWRCD